MGSIESGTISASALSALIRDTAAAWRTVNRSERAGPPVTRLEWASPSISLDTVFDVGTPATSEERLSMSLATRRSPGAGQGRHSTTSPARSSKPSKQ